MRFLSDERLYSETGHCLRFLESVPAAPAIARPWRAHMYWRGPFSRKPALAVKSFLATQHAGAELWLWLDVEDGYRGCEHNPFLMPLLPHLTVNPFDAAREAIGTPLEGRPDLYEKLPPVRRSNLARFVALFKYGGLYADMDVLFLRDLTPLFEDARFSDEFCYRWSAHLPYGNSAVLALRRESATAEALLARCRERGSCRPRDVLRFGEDPDVDLLVLPCPFFDPLWPRRDGQDLTSDAPFDRFEDFFRRFGWRFARPTPPPTVETFFPGAFAFHWHNNWRLRENEQSYFGLFDRELDAKLADRRRSRTAHHA
jgi:hypothetical protein